MRCPFESNWTGRSASLSRRQAFMKRLMYPTSGFHSDSDFAPNHSPRLNAILLRLTASADKKRLPAIVLHRRTTAGPVTCVILFGVAGALWLQPQPASGYAHPFYALKIKEPTRVSAFIVVKNPSICLSVPEERILFGGGPEPVQRRIPEPEATAARASHKPPPVPWMEDPGKSRGLHGSEPVDPDPIIS